MAAANEAVRSAPIDAIAIASQLPPSAEGDEPLIRAAAEWALSESEQAARKAGENLPPTFARRHRH